MASIIKLKRSNTGGSVPSGGSLAAGEIAVNTADGLLFTSSNGSDIVSLGQTAASIQASAALANTNAYIASVQSDVDSNEAAELVRLSNTNAYIASVQSDVDSNEAAELVRLSNTNAYIASVQSDVDANEAAELVRLSNTNAYIADVKTTGATWNDGTDTLTFTRGDSSTYTVALTGFPSDSVSNTYVQLLLSNTNAYIAAVQSDVDANETTAATAVSNLVDGTTAFTGIDVNGGNIDGATIATSDITVGSGKTLNVSAGTLTLADNQISGDKIDGGTISNFASVGIDDNATATKVTVADAKVTISTAAEVTGNLTVGGNLDVEGTVTYLGTTTVNVEDNMMKLTANNTGDVTDTGIYGKYVDSGTTKYSGYFRDATDGVTKFFTGLTVEPTGTTVDVSDASYAIGTVEAVLDGGTF
jgi:hypothetical protein